MKLRTIILETLILMVIISAASFASPDAQQAEQYVHHQYIFGTARIDYVEKVDGRSLVTYYYKYDDSANKFLVTSVEAYSGSKYYRPRLLKVFRYAYDSRHRLLAVTS